MLCINGNPAKLTGFGPFRTDFKMAGFKLEGHKSAAAAFIKAVVEFDILKAAGVNVGTERVDNQVESVADD